MLVPWGRSVSVFDVAAVTLSDCWPEGVTGNGLYASVPVDVAVADASAANGIMAAIANTPHNLGLIVRILVGVGYYCVIEYRCCVFRLKNKKCFQ